MVLQQNLPGESSSAEVSGTSWPVTAPLLWWLSDAAVQIEHTPYTLFGLRNGEKDPRLIMSVTEREYDRAIAILAWRQTASAEQGRDARSIAQAAITWLTTPHLKNILDAYLQRADALKRLLESPEPENLPQYVPCAECSTVNTAGHRYCSSCGRHLWDVCYECGTFGRACDAFCGCCGKNKPAVLETWRQHGTTSLNNAASAWAESRRKTALDLWYSLATSHDWRLHTFSIQAAKQWLQHYAEWLKWKVQQDDLQQRAAAAGQQGDWQQQLEYLDQISDDFLSPDTISFRNGLRKRLAAVQQLSSQLQKALQDKRWTACCQYVDQIIDIDSKNAFAVRVRDVLVEKACHVAGALLEKGKIREAKQALELAPRTGQSAKYSELWGRIEELLWLDKYIEQHPTADNRLLELCKIAANANLAGAKERLESLTAFLQKHSTKGKQQPLTPPWFRRPSKGCLGIPVTIVREFPGVTFDPSAATNATDLATAIGLAIQAVGAARFPTSLHTDAPPSLLPWRRGRTTSAWGLELSLPVSRLVRMERVAAQEFRVTHVSRITAAGSEAHVSTADRDYSQILSQLPQHIPPQTTETLVLACPYLGMFWKRLTLPTAQPAEIQTMIRYEAKLAIPLALDDLYCGFHVLSTGQGCQQTVGVLCAIKRAPFRPILDQLRQLFPKCTIVLQAAPFAQANLLCQLSSTAHTCPASALLDIDLLHTSLVLFSGMNLWYRQLRFCGEQVLSRLTSSARLTREQARRIVFQQDAVPERISHLRGVEEEFFHLCREIQNSFQWAQKEDTFTPERLYVTGGSATMNDLFRALLYGPVIDSAPSTADVGIQ